MGNSHSLRSSFKKRSGTKKERSMDDLSGLEITVDTLELPGVSEIDPLPGNNEASFSLEEQCSNTVDFTSPRGRTLRMSETSDHRKSQKLSSDDLMACLIPGMDPLEMLELMEQCAHEDIREKELNELNRSQEFSQKKRSKGKRSAKNALNHTTA